MRSHSPTKVINNKSGIRNYLPPSSLVGLKSSVLVAYSPKTKHEIGSTVGLLGLLEFCGSGIVERSGGYVGFGDVCGESFVLFCEDPRQHLGGRICYVVELLALISDVVSLRKISHPM